MTLVYESLSKLAAVPVGKVGEQILENSARSYLEFVHTRKLGLDGRFNEDFKKYKEPLDNHLTKINQKVDGYNQYIGIEVELENCTRGLSRAYTKASGDFDCFWIIKEDGSLRNKGLEFVSIIGLNIPSAMDAVFALHEYLKQDFPKATPNARTGLHIHYEVQNKTLYELANILTLYSFLEPVLFQLSGERTDNIYCVPWYANKVSLGWVINEIRNLAVNERFSNWKWRNYSKYCALNISTIGTFGTLEFRHHKGTKEPEEILDWLFLIDRLGVVAKTNNLIEFLLRFREGRTDKKLWALVEDFFPDKLFKLHSNKEALLVSMRAAILNFYKGFVDTSLLPSSKDVQRRLPRRPDDLPERVALEDVVREVPHVQIGQRYYGWLEEVPNVNEPVNPINPNFWAREAER
jgi:hypothetical protein